MKSSPDKVIKYIILAVSAGLVIASLFIEPKWRVDISVFKAIGILWGFYLLMNLCTKKEGGTVSFMGWTITIKPGKDKSGKNKQRNDDE